MSLEEYFAEAADRLQGGEPIEQILADYPLAVRAELQTLLAVVEMAEQVAAITPPQPIPINRIASRVMLAERAAQLRAELEANNKAIDTVRAPLSPQPTAQPLPTLRQEQSAGWWGRVKELLTWPTPTPLMRLAPLTFLLAVIYLLTSTVVVAAKESLPGNPVYPVRLWMLEQGVATAPVQQKAEARWLVDRALAGDVARLAEQLQSKPDAAPIQVESIQQFRGFDEDHLLIGDLRVIPWHQPADVGPDDWFPISIDGTLEPGATVTLRYQIVPGATNVVQGIELIVLESPTMPTPLPTLTPTTVPAAGTHCQRIQPPNWVAYVVRPGENLSNIAARAQTSVAELRRVNCLTDGSVRAGTTIFVPMTILGRVPSAPPPAVVTALPTRIVPPTATFTPLAPTDTPSPPTSAPTLTPTSESATPEPSAVAPESTDAPTPTPSAGATSTPTTAPTVPGDTGTPAATELPAPSPTPSATAENATPPTEQPTEQSTEQPTAQPIEQPTEQRTPTPTPAATSAAPATPTAAPTSTESAPTPAPTNTSAPAPAPVEPSPTPSAPTPTAVDSSGSASATSTATQPPPTATQPPPTATQPPPTATQPPPTATQPPPTATQPPPTATQPPPTATQPPDTDG